MIGQNLDGKYRILRQLGEGGMGAVYEAEHLGTGRRVAVKVIVSALAAHSDMLSRFQREAKAAGSIDTQHIVQVLDSGTDGATGNAYMVMEYLRGEDVQQLVSRLGPLPPDLALRVVAQACVGLQRAHEAHVVHRDIKPANLYLAQREGELIVKVLDFGIAKVKLDQFETAEGAALTRTGSMLGSPLYMSPEQAKGLKTVDHRTDIWSLGVVLYQALTGQTPHGHVDTIGQLIIAICSEQPGSVQDIAPWVRPEVAEIVRRAVQLDPAQRYQTAAEMLEAIRALLPNGATIQAPMLVGISPRERAEIAPRFVGAAGAALEAPVSPFSSTGVAGAHAMTHPAARSGATAAPPASGGMPGWAPLALAAVVLLGVAGAGAALYKSRARARKPPAAVAHAVASASSFEPAPPLASVASAPPARAARLSVLPPNAFVELDGSPASVDGGTVEIKGALGTIHHVKVTLGERAAEKDVILTEAGAYPATIELGVGTGKRGGGGGGGGGRVGHPGTGPAVTPDPARPAAPADKKREEIDRKFE